MLHRFRRPRSGLAAEQHTPTTKADGLARDFLTPPPPPLIKRRFCTIAMARRGFFFEGGQKQAAREFSTCLCQIKSWRSCQTKLGHEAHRDIRRGALSRLLVPTAADQRKCRLEKPACSLHTNFLSLVAVSPIGPLPAKTMSPSFIASHGRVARRPDPIMSSQDGRPRHTTGHVCSGFGEVGAVSLGSEESQSLFCLTHWAKDTLAKLSN
jgi:hypothetical protein